MSILEECKNGFIGLRFAFFLTFLIQERRVADGHFKTDGAGIGLAGCDDLRQPFPVHIAVERGLMLVAVAVVIVQVQRFQTVLLFFQTVHLAVTHIEGFAADGFAVGMTGVVADPDVLCRIFGKDLIHGIPVIAPHIFQRDLSSVHIENGQKIVQGALKDIQFPAGCRHDFGVIFIPHLEHGEVHHEGTAFFGFQFRHHLNAVDDQFHARFALIFQFGVPAFFLSLTAVDIQQGQAEILKHFLVCVDLVLTVKEIRAPLVAPVKMGESCFCEETEGAFRTAGAADVVGCCCDFHDTVVPLCFFF